MLIEKGDVLIDRKTSKQFPVKYVCDGHAYLEIGSRMVKRAFGQIIRHRKKFIHLKVGQMIQEDYAFFDPKKNRIVIIEKGTIFLGDV